MSQRRPFKADHPKNRRPRWLVSCALAATFLCAPALATVQPDPDRFSSIVIDASSGRVLSAVNPDAERFPASLTKMMTLYLAFEALRDHRISPNELVPVSAHAASQEPSKLGLVPGSQITVHQAMLGLVTKSANDAASALGELIGGSEDHFAQMMTLRAHALGMTHSNFRNASGLPDAAQVTTAHDLALLARHLVRDFPDQYPLFSTPSFFWHGQLIANHDNLLKSYPGADGIKTGYTDAAGHNLVTSAVRDNVRLIGVVLGADSNPHRDARMAAMLNNGYSQLNIAAPAATVIAAAAPASPPHVALAIQQSRHSRHFPSLIASAEAATLPASQHLRGYGDSNWSIANWSVQIGSYSHETAARHVAETAARTTDGAPHVERATYHGKTMFRAQIAGLHQADAASYCRHHPVCSIIQPDRIASR